MFGALAGSGLLHGTGYIHAVLPWWIGSSAVIALGALVGSRFANTTARMLVGYLGAACGSFAVSMAVAAFFIAIVAYFFPFPIANMVIAFSPGARDTMMVLALALHLDPVYVGAHHLARFLVVTFSVAIAASDRAAKDRGEQSQTAGANEDRAIIPRSHALAEPWRMSRSENYFFDQRLPKAAVTSFFLIRSRGLPRCLRFCSSVPSPIMPG